MPRILIVFFFLLLLKFSHAQRPPEPHTFPAQLKLLDTLDAGRYPYCGFLLIQIPVRFEVIEAGTDIFKRTKITVLVTCPLERFGKQKLLPGQTLSFNLRQIAGELMKDGELCYEAF